jgi:hypothetical protein
LLNDAPNGAAAPVGVDQPIEMSVRAVNVGAKAAKVQPQVVLRASANSKTPEAEM